MTIQPKINHKLLGTILVVVSGVLYGMIGYFGVKLFEQGYSVPSMLFWRFLTATLWILLTCLVLHKQRKRMRRPTQGRAMLRLAAIGSASYGAGSAFFYLSCQHIGTGPAMVIFFSFPVYVMLFSVYFKQAALNRYMIMSLVMVIAGLILLNGRGSHNLNNMGILLASIAAFSYGVYVYYNQHSSKYTDSLSLTLYVCMGCAVIFLFFSLFTHTFQVPHTVRAWRDILILGIIATAIPIQLLLNGLKYISSVKASILSVMEPVTTVIVGVLFLQESLLPMQIAGIIIVLAGAITIQFEKQPDISIEAPLK